jgi:hypothetical protein
MAKKKAAKKKVVKKKAAKKKVVKKKQVKLENLVVVSKVKDYIKTKDMFCSADVIEGLTCAVACIVDKAAARAKENGRKTIKKIDL